MSSVQIAAIISLLLAFGVGQSTVTNVQNILLASQKNSTMVVVPGTSATSNGQQDVQSSQLVTPLHIFEVKLESLDASGTPDLYIQADKNIASASVNGTLAKIVQTTSTTNTYTVTLTNIQADKSQGYYQAGQRVQTYPIRIQAPGYVTCSDNRPSTIAASGGPITDFGGPLPLQVSVTATDGSTAVYSLDTFSPAAGLCVH